MTTLTVTTRGQITFRKDILEHLGVQHGGKIRLHLLPNGRVELEASKGEGSWQELGGMLKDKTNGARLSIQEIHDAIGDAAADAALKGLRSR